jgi:hypothetical protein
VLAIGLPYSPLVNADSHTYDGPFQWIEKEGEAAEQALDPEVEAEVKGDLSSKPADTKPTVVAPGTDKARTEAPITEAGKGQTDSAVRTEAGPVASTPAKGAGNAVKPRLHPNGESLTAQASDPTAPLLQVQVTNFYAPSNRNADSYSNLLNFQPVIPVAANDVIPWHQVMRFTVPVITTPKPDRETGLGDISYFDIFVPGAEDWGIWGAGFTAVAPTASDDELGAGKFQLGPAFTAVYYKKKNWQIGAVVQNPVSFAGEGSRDDVAQLQIQPIINYLYGDWYFGAGDFNIIWDWEEDEATIPVAFQAGKIVKIGKYKYNLSAELAWTAVYPDDTVTPRWGIRLGFVWLLPES